MLFSAIRIAIYCDKFRNNFNDPDEDFLVHTRKLPAKNLDQVLRCFVYILIVLRTDLPDITFQNRKGLALISERSQ